MPFDVFQDRPLLLSQPSLGARRLLLLVALSGLTLGQAQMGHAAELPSLIVTTTDDVIADDNQTSLREAIAHANRTGDTAPETITFNVVGTITLSNSLPNIVSAASSGELTLQGPAGGVVISGNNAVRILTTEAGANLTIDSLTLSGGRALGDGGALVNNGTLKVSNSTLSGNVATGKAGAISNSGTLVLTNSTLGNNSANMGGAFYNSGLTTVANSTLSGNVANVGGGGILNLDGSTTTVTNSIVAGNTDQGGSSNSLGIVNFQGYNLVGTASTAKLGGLANNGGPTKTFALLAGSPAINGGDPGYAGPLTTDQRGAGYDRITGGRLDLGAFESGSYPHLVVTTKEDVVATDTIVSLREAIEYANRTGDTTPETITFSVVGTITLSSSLPNIASAIDSGNLTIQGPAGGVVISGNNAVRILTTEMDANLTIDSLTLSHGLSSGDGSAILNNGTLAVSKSTLSDNVANGNGGGLFNNGTLTLVNSTVANNTAASGGGLYNDGQATLRNSTLSGNQATTGGGIYGLSPVSVANSIIAGNSDANGSPNVFGGFDGQGNNLIGTAAAAKLGSLTDNGGPTKTFALLPGSPAFNTGDPSYVGSLTTDQRGAGFPRVNHGQIDLGAFEALRAAPTSISLSRNIIAENAGNNIFIGQLAGTDPDMGDSLGFSLPSGLDDNADFSISGNQLRAVSSFDYETKSSYAVTVRATDADGLTFDQQFTITVTESTKPTIAISTPAASARLLINNFTPGSITGIATDNIGVSSVRVRLARKRGTSNYYWNGTDFVTTQSTVLADLNGSDWTLSTNAPPVNKLDAGIYSLQVSAYDAASNKSAYAERSFTLQSDAVAPTLAICTPTANQKLLISDFTGGAVGGPTSDDVAVTAVKVRLSRKRGTTNYYWNGTEFGTASAYVDAQIDGTSWSLGTATLAAGKLDNGTYQVEAYALDAANNKSATSKVSFTLNSDYSAPSVSIATPTSSKVIKINEFTAETITGSASDNLGVTSVKLKLQRKRNNVFEYWNGTAFTTTSVLFDASFNSETGGWSYDSAIPASALDAGGYTLYATAFDEAGNKTTSAARGFSIVGTASAADAISVAGSSANGS